MLRVGLIGIPLGHSWSADYFARQYPDCRYHTYEMASLEGLRRRVEAEGLDGFNVTIPYKRDIIGLLDVVDDTAAHIGAVNCVCVRRADGHTTLTGYNTDAQAFTETLLPFLQPWHKRALILGTGGAAQAVGYALQQLGIEHTFVSRHPERHPNAIGYEQLAQSIQFTIHPKESSRHWSLVTGHNTTFNILINATPIGMWPNVEESPMTDMQGIGPQHLCYDLIYNPEESRWLREAAQRGATTCNGLTMLHRQADLSLEQWKKNRN